MKMVPVKFKNNFGHDKTIKKGSAPVILPVFLMISRFRLCGVKILLPCMTGNIMHVCFSSLMMLVFIGNDKLSRHASILLAKRLCVFGDSAGSFIFMCNRVFLVVVIHQAKD